MQSSKVTTQTRRCKLYYYEIELLFPGNTLFVSHHDISIRSHFNLHSALVFSR